MSLANRLLNSFFGSDSPTASRLEPRTRLGMERLEAREVPSVTSISIDRNSEDGTLQLEVYLDNSRSNVGIFSSGGQIRIEDTTTHRTFRPVPLGPIKTVVVFGGSADDRVVNTASNLQLRAYGRGGNDILQGNGKNDVLDGGDGNDTLLGFGGNDRLYGGAGKDTLRGMDGNDYLNGGSGDDAIDGGNGTDTFRRVMTVAGMGFTLGAPNNNDEGELADTPEQVAGAFLTGATESASQDNPFAVNQAGTATCAFLASLSAVAGRSDRSDDLVQAIRYNAASDSYDVPMFVNGRKTTVNVNGDWTEGRDPGGSLWVTLYQKAYLKAMGVYTRVEGVCQENGAWVNSTGVNWQNLGVAMTALTGQSTTFHTPKNGSTGNLSAATLRADLAAGRVFCAATVDTPASSKVVGDHCYAIRGIDSQNRVTLYNPWGSDGRTVADGKDDGLVTLSWAEFCKDFGEIQRL